MAYATPYLLALGLSKSMLSLVWVAGPLSGLVMQPVIGAISDQSRSKYGRRRPFMVFGSVAVAVCLVLLGWASEIVGWFTADEEKVCLDNEVLCVWAQVRCVLMSGAETNGYGFTGCGGYLCA